MIILNFQLFRNVFFIPIFRNVKTFSMNIWHLFIVKISNSHIMDCCYFTTITIDVKPSIATDITTMCKSFICLFLWASCLLIIHSNCYKFHNISSVKWRTLTWTSSPKFIYNLRCWNKIVLWILQSCWKRI